MIKDQKEYSYSVLNIEVLPISYANEFLGLWGFSPQSEKLA